MSEIDLFAALGYDAFQAIEQSSIPKTQRPSMPASEGGYVEQEFDPGSSGLFGAELPGRWKSRQDVLRQYRAINVGYYLFDREGLTRSWTFPGAWLLPAIARRLTTTLIRVPVPGWYDTHARHSSVSAPTGNV